MSYQPTTDFVGLWRAQTTGAVKGEMPGLDFMLAALQRAGVLNVSFSGAAPTSNQATTAWYKPATPSYSGEGTLYLWNGAAYVAATPALFGNHLGVAATAPIGANVLLNSGFRINQGGYSSGGVLAAGAYGHDQWKAGASGGDYTFTLGTTVAQITIAAGKSLIQPIENFNITGTSYVLSWTGTAQARVGINTLTPSGSYAASPLLITGQTAGIVMSVEFNSGTLSAAKLELGTAPTTYIIRPYAEELFLCQRYYEILGVGGGHLGAGHCIDASNAYITINYVTKYSNAPTIGFRGTISGLKVFSNGTSIQAVAAIGTAHNGDKCAEIDCQTAGGLTPNYATALYSFDGTVITVSSRL
jgi:hypothetical protein